jgi:hypothetical protein
LVEGCPLPGRNQLGVRLRVAHSGQSPFPEKRRTDAIYSVESAGYLCDPHSLAGGSITLDFRPSGDGNASVTATSGSTTTETRRKPIRQPMDEAA